MKTTIGSATTSSAITTYPGRDVVFQCFSAGAFVAVLQQSLDGTNWCDVYIDPTTTAAFGTVNSYVVPGGPSYRVNVTTWNATVTFQGIEAGS